MIEEEKKAIEYFNNIRATIEESYVLFNEGINIKCEKEMGEKIIILLNLITKLQKENKLLEFQKTQIKNYAEELKKYDYRKIKIDEENKIKSPSFTKEQLDLMNLGIALYVGIPKLLEDEEGEIEV